MGLADFAEGHPADEQVKRDFDPSLPDSSAYILSMKSRCLALKLHSDVFSGGPPLTSPVAGASSTLPGVSSTGLR